MYNSPISIPHGPLELEYIDKYLKSTSSAEEHYIAARVRSTLGVNIDRDELIKALNYDRQQYEKGYEDGKRDAVKQGRWDILEDDYMGLTLIKCSLCHEEWCFEVEPEDIQLANYNYCPHCGAKMDEKGDAE